MKRIKTIEKRVDVLHITDERKRKFYEKEVEENKRVYCSIAEIRVKAHNLETGENKEFNQDSFLKNWKKIKSGIIQDLIKREKEKRTYDEALDRLAKIRNRALKAFVYPTPVLRGAR